MKTTNENPIQPMEDQPAKPVHIEKQENHNCQQFYGPVTGCVFAMPGATVNQYPNAVTTQNDAASKPSAPENATRNPQLSKKTFWSMSCVCTPCTSARSGGRSMKHCGRRYSNCLPFQLPFTTRVSNKELPSTAILWRTSST